MVLCVDCWRFWCFVLVFVIDWFVGVLWLH